MLPSPVVKQCQQQALGEAGCVQRCGLGVQFDALDELPGSGGCAEPQAGTDDFREAVEANHTAVVLVETEEGGQPGRQKLQIIIGVVLDDKQVELFCDLEELQPPLDIHCGATGVAASRNRVKDFRPRRARPSRQDVTQQRRHDAFVVGGHLHQLSTKRLQEGQAAAVCGRLYEDGVTRVQQRLKRLGEGVLAARRHTQVKAARVLPVLTRLKQLQVLYQPWQALRWRVLQQLFHVVEFDLSAIFERYGNRLNGKLRGAGHSPA
mmetsp:Transcript_11151/g.32348  ORF Transcript_11151/g.32348 Transcript_11151/m.32348 type:complete len:264 (+) Transcript_11151:637-1428(+)